MKNQKPKAMSIHIYTIYSSGSFEINFLSSLKVSYKCFWPLKKPSLSNSHVSKLVILNLARTKFHI